MKLGIIGTGLIVKEFLPIIQEIEGVDIISIMSTARSYETCKELCLTYNIENAVCDFEEFIKTGIDTVYVAVPNFLHVDYCKQAMNAGLNVICEKPMTSNYRETKELFDLALKNQVFLFEAITTLYLGTYNKIKEWLPRIGTVKLVDSQFNQYSRRYDNFRKGIIEPVFDPNKAGGAMMDLNLYNIYFVLGLFGKPDTYQYFANIEKGIDTSGVLLMKYDGFVSTCVAAKDCKGNIGATIEGTKGCIRSHLAANMVGRVTLELNDGTREEFDDNMAFTRCVPEFKAFINAINNEDYEFCYDMLQVSLDVSEIQTNARLNAGIVFPVDK